MQILTIALKVTGNMRSVVLIWAISAGLVIVMSVPMMLLGGIEGAICVAVLSYVLAAIVTWRQIHSRERFRINNRMMTPCMACGSEKWDVTEKSRSYELATCSDCGLTFTVNPDYSGCRYQVAYEETQGEAPVPQEHAYVYTAPQERLRLETQAICLPRPRRAGRKMCSPMAENERPQERICD